MNYYDPVTKEVYLNDGTSFEGYSVYGVENGIFVLKYGMDGDEEPDSYYRRDANNNFTPISTDEMNAFRTAFQSGFEQYGFTGEVLCEENISKILGK